MSRANSILTSLLFFLAFANSASAGPLLDFGGRKFSLMPTGPTSDSTGGRYTIPADDQTAESQLVTNVPGAANNVNTNIGADRFYNAGITGQNSVTANVEAGHIWSGHETLGHVTSFVHDPSAFYDPMSPGTQQEQLTDRHATWVGAHIGGRLGGAVQGERQRGVAYNTDLQSGAIATSWTQNAYSLGFDFISSSFDTPYRAFFGAADVINSSWGFTDAPGTHIYTIWMDAFSDQNTSTTLVASAGNSGPGSNTVGSPGAGYNAITVGALQNDGSNNYDSVASFSSRGPQDWAGGGLSCTECRAAVDLVAPGTGLAAAYYGGQGGGNHSTLTGSPSGSPGGADSYTSGLQGTSFAAPITAGASALLYSASRNTPSLVSVSESRDARVIKSVLMNSADKIPGWTNNQTLENGIMKTTQALDTASGAGALNLDTAFDQYVNAATKGVPGMASGNQGSVGLSGFDLGEVTVGTDNVYTISQPITGGTTMNVTLTWFRDRFESVPVNGYLFDNAQADLDLFIRDTNTNEVVAQSISALNVSEHLSFTVPSTGLYQIEVRLDSFLFDNSTVPLTTEQYGLAWSAIPEPSAYLFMGLTATSVGVVQTLRNKLLSARS